MKKLTPILPHRKCPVCGGPDIGVFYMGDRRYRFRCFGCGQYFEFNARNQLQAETFWNELFKR